MIHARYTVTCDGCGLIGPQGAGSPLRAHQCAQAEGWTTNTVTEHLGALHWCPACTEARKES